MTYARTDQTDPRPTNGLVFKAAATLACTAGAGLGATVAFVAGNEYGNWMLNESVAMKLYLWSPVVALGTLSALLSIGAVGGAIDTYQTFRAAALQKTPSP